MLFFDFNFVPFPVASTRMRNKHTNQDSTNDSRDYGNIKLVIVYYILLYVLVPN